VSQGATASEIRAAYRRLARKLHPDRNPGDRDAERRFKEISAAYSALTDDGEAARVRAAVRPPRPARVVPAPVFARRRGPRGSTFETGAMEPGKMYNVRPGPTLGARVPLNAAADPMMPQVPLFVKGRRTCSS
jgi:hypothetical protein